LEAARLQGAGRHTCGLFAAYRPDAAGRALTRFKARTQTTSLLAQIRDYDICLAEFLKPSCDGQKIMQAILLREAFCRFAQQEVEIKQDAPTEILDVSCGPGDYSVAWTSDVA
jgi:hypothetical protein